MEPEVIAALRRAVASAPEDSALRLHLVDQLLVIGDRVGAITEIAAILQRDPADDQARRAMNRALDAPVSEQAEASADEGSVDPDRPDPADTFDWAAAESQIDETIDPMPAPYGSDAEESSDAEEAKSGEDAEDA